MHTKTNVKAEAPPSDDDLPNEKALKAADFATNIKIETTTSGNEFEKHNKNIEVEADGNVHNGKQCFSINLESNIKNGATACNYDFEMDSKISIKEEPIFSDSELQSIEYLDCMGPTTKLKNDTMTVNDCKMESQINCRMQEFVSDLTSENDKKSFIADLVIKTDKDTFIQSDRGEGTATKTEFDCHSKAPSVPDISQANDNGESDSLTAKDLQSSKSLRFTSDAVDHDSNPHIFADASDVRTSNAKDADQKTSLNCDASCITQRFESVGNIADKKIQVYKCLICEKKCSSHWELNRHSSSHSEQKQFKCVYCEKCFTHKSNLRAHTFLHSGTSPHKCEHCDRRFTSKTHLSTHVLLHSGTKPYKCEHCQKCFYTKVNLKIHAVCHTGAKPYKCELCERCFPHKSSLNRHISLHSGTKPYKCEQCQKCFTLKLGLKRHALLHSGTKPYKCEHCEKCFTQKGNLKEHLGLHSGTKPYKCEHCGKCFKFKSNFKRHKLMHRT